VVDSNLIRQNFNQIEETHRTGIQNSIIQNERLTQEQLSYLFFGNPELNNLIPETLIRLTRYTSSVTQDPTLLYPCLNTIMLFSLGEEMYDIYNLIDNLTIFFGAIK